MNDAQPLTAHSVVMTAADLVGGARHSTHGDKLENHTKIAAVWNSILLAAGKSPSTPLDAHDVATLMEGLKIARRYLGEFNPDDYIDGAGYAGVAGEIKSKLVAQEKATQAWADAVNADRREVERQQEEMAAQKREYEAARLIRNARARRYRQAKASKTKRGKR